jgi:hypothetical protein
MMDILFLIRPGRAVCDKVCYFVLGPFVSEAADMGQEHTLNVSTRNMCTYTGWHHVRYTILVQSIENKIHYRLIPTIYVC